MSMQMSLDEKGAHKLPTFKIVVAFCKIEKLASKACYLELSRFSRATSFCKTCDVSVRAQKDFHVLSTQPGRLQATEY